MKVNLAKLLRVFQRVELLEEQMKVYCKDPERIPVPWQHVVDAVEQIAGTRVTVTRFTAEVRAIYGMVERFDDKTARILARAGLAEDVENFTIIKEAAHILVDEDEDLSPDGVTTLEKLVMSSFFGLGKNQQDASDGHQIVQSEHLATIAAAAIVVPRRERHGLIADLKSGKTTLAKTALWLKVPEAIVSLATSETFHNYCEQAMQIARPE